MNSITPDKNRTSKSYELPLALEVVWRVAVVIFGVETGTEGGTALFTPELWEDPAVTADKKSSNSSADIASLAPEAEALTSSSRLIRVVLSRSALGSGDKVI